MNELAIKPFDLNLDYNGRKVRVVGSYDHPEWVAADVCEVLGIGNPSQTLASFDQDERGGITINDTPLLTVTEPGLYRLILKSRKPEAKPFKRWVVHEVLPCIRRHGCYPAPEVELWDNRAIVTRNDENLALQITRGLMPILEGMASGQTKLHEKISDVETKVDTLADRMANIERRKDLSARDKRRHTDVVHKTFGGRCPCCASVSIVDHEGSRLDRAQFDHWQSVSQSHISLTWLICDSCNLKMRDGDYRRSKRAYFEAYQARREEYETKRQPTLFS